MIGHNEKKSLFAEDWEELTLSNWPGWDRDERGNLIHVDIQTTDPKFWAGQFDKVALGSFYFVPFSEWGVRHTRFYFAKKSDRRLFNQMVGGL